MQTWEYLELYRTRGWKASKFSEEWREPQPWVYYISTESGTQKSSIDDLLALLTMLGRDGWELVTAVPRSDFTGDKESDIAGFTGSETWVFKRPKGQ